MTERAEQNCTGKSAVCTCERPWVKREVVFYMEGLNNQETVVTEQAVKQPTKQSKESPEKSGQPVAQYVRPLNEFYSY